MKSKSSESIRIFKNPILEACTHVHPIVPLLLWTPFVVFLLYRSYFVQNLKISEILMWGFLGLLVWTFTEYILHRYVFHFNGKSKASKVFVYLFHGLHHDDPNDPTRLVMPPVPAILIMTLLYSGFSLIIPGAFIESFMAFFTIGYLIYDYIHYATHHFPMTGRVAKYLKRWHLQHHYSKEEAKFGVSSPLWDYVFRTQRGPKTAKETFEWKTL